MGLGYVDQVPLIDASEHIAVMCSSTSMTSSILGVVQRSKLPTYGVFLARMTTTWSIRCSVRVPLCNRRVVGEIFSFGKGGDIFVNDVPQISRIWYVVVGEFVVDKTGEEFISAKRHRYVIVHVNSTVLKNSFVGSVTAHAFYDDVRPIITLALFLLL